MTDAIIAIVNLLNSNWNVSPKPSIEDIAVLDRGEGKRVRMQDKDVVRVLKRHTTKHSLNCFSISLTSISI